MSGSKTLLEIYNDNPTTTPGTNDLFYILNSPYGDSDNSGISWINILNNVKAGGVALSLNNDTNVTLTGGGSSTTALLNASSITAGWTGQLAISRGGTGVSSVTTSPTATAFAGWDANSNLSANSFIQGYATTANTGGTTTLTVSSKQVQYFTGTLNQSVVMPVVSTLALGQTYTISNISSGNVTVRSSGTNVIVTLGTNEQVVIRCISLSGTDASSWSYFKSDVNGEALSASNDTNVTLTLGGNYSEALVNAASITAGWTGQLAISRGGTGVSSVTTSPTASAFAGWDANSNLSANSFIPGFAEITTSGGVTTLTVASAQTQYFVGSSTQDVKMPVSTTVALGQKYTLINASSSSISVQDTNAVELFVLNSLTNATITCISHTNAERFCWDYTHYTGSMVWETLAVTSKTAESNHGYVIGDSSQTTVTLPDNCYVGDVVAVCGTGAGGWILAANTGQIIRIASGVTSSGGNLTSTNRYDNVQVVCIDGSASPVWMVQSVMSEGLTVN